MLHIVCPDGVAVALGPNEVAMVTKTSARLASALGPIPVQHGGGAGGAPRQLPIQGIEARALRTALALLAGGSPALEIMDVPAIMDAALKLEAPVLLEGLCSFVNTAMSATPSACLALLKACRGFTVGQDGGVGVQLRSCAVEVAKNRIQDIVATPDFLAAPAELLADILPGVPATQAVHALACWIAHDPQRDSLQSAMVQLCKLGADASRSVSEQVASLRSKAATAAAEAAFKSGSLFNALLSCNPSSDVQQQQQQQLPQQLQHLLQQNQLQQGLSSSGSAMQAMPSQLLNPGSSLAVSPQLLMPGQGMQLQMAPNQAPLLSALAPNGLLQSMGMPAMGPGPSQPFIAPHQLPQHPTQQASQDLMAYLTAAASAVGITLPSAQGSTTGASGQRGNQHMQLLQQLQQPASGIESNSIQGTAGSQAAGRPVLTTSELLAGAARLQQPASAAPLSTPSLADVMLQLMPNANGPLAHNAGALTGAAVGAGAQGGTGLPAGAGAGVPGLTGMPLGLQASQPMFAPGVTALHAAPTQNPLLGAHHGFHASHSEALPTLLQPPQLDPFTMNTISLPGRLAGLPQGSWFGGSSSAQSMSSSFSGTAGVKGSAQALGSSRAPHHQLGGGGLMNSSQQSMFTDPQGGLLLQQLGMSGEGSGARQDMEQGGLSTSHPPPTRRGRQQQQQHQQGASEAGPLDLLLGAAAAVHEDVSPSKRQAQAGHRLSSSQAGASGSWIAAATGRGRGNNSGAAAWGDYGMSDPQDEPMVSREADRKGAGSIAAASQKSPSGNAGGGGSKRRRAPAANGRASSSRDPQGGAAGATASAFKPSNSGPPGQANTLGSLFDACPATLLSSMLISSAGSCEIKGGRAQTLSSPPEVGYAQSSGAHDPCIQEAQTSHVPKPCLSAPPCQTSGAIEGGSLMPETAGGISSAVKMEEDRAGEVGVSKTGGAGGAAAAEGVTAHVDAPGEGAGSRQQPSVSADSALPPERASSEPASSAHPAGIPHACSSAPLPSQQAGGDTERSSLAWALMGMGRMGEPPAISAHQDPLKSIKVQLPKVYKLPQIRGICHIDGCFADLSHLRDYHLRYRICEFHLKATSIMRDGAPQRFCQQCGRFHELAAFDGSRRSCRAMLQRHNARRAKKLVVLPDSQENGAE